MALRYGNSSRRTRTKVDLLVLFLLLVGGGVTSSLDVGLQLSIAQGVRSTVLFPFLAFHEGFVERARVAERLQALRVERDSLTGEVLKLRYLAEQGRDAIGLAGLDHALAGGFVPAELVPGSPRVGDSHVFLLRGSNVAEVVPPAGVLTGAGLVGVLRTVDSRGGEGEFWSHPDFRVSVRTEVGETTGIVRAVRRGSGPPAMLLEGAPYQEEIPSGTGLVTTGLAGIYPPGVKVGTVISVSEVQSGWAKSYFVRPVVRPELARFILVWRRADPTGG